MPSEYDRERERIRRRRRMAEALMTSQAPQGQMVGRFYVAPNPLQNIAALGSQFMGSRLDRRLDQEEEQAEKTERERMAAALRSSQNPNQPPDPQREQAIKDFGLLPLDVQRQAFAGHNLQKVFPAPPKLHYQDAGDNIQVYTEDGRFIRAIPKGASPDARLSQEGQNQRHATPSGSARLGEQGAMARHSTPSGSAQLGANTTMRDQDMGDARAREQMEIERAKAAAGASGKPLTEFQAKAVGQLARMQGAEQVIGQMEGYIPSVSARAAAGVPGVGNVLTSEAFQNYQQAAREWISGVLRLDSGAAVPEVEFERYFATYFPQPGDGPDVVAQKTNARQRATDALRGSLSDISDRLPPPPTSLPTQAPAGDGDAELQALVQQYLPQAK